MPLELPPAGDNLALPVKHLVKRPPLFVDANATVAQAASAMQNARVGSVLVASDPPGIVTDRDLRGRVLASNLAPETPVREVMTRPLKTLDSDAPLFAALRLMVEENIHHLALVEEGKIVGVISGTDLLRQQAGSPFYLRGVLDSLEDPGALAHYGAEIAAMVQSLFRGGLDAIQIGRIVSSLNDALVKRLVHLGERALGPPPAPFAWIVFGSEGRMEQMLLTDQDNALIYERESKEGRAYFAALAERVVAGLIEVGFPRCPGGFMATSWCKPLGEWRSLFSGWVRTPNAEALLDAAIFFDFRSVAGALSLAPLEEIFAGAATEKLFIAHMAGSAVELAPPLGFFNRMRTESGGVELKKGGIGPIVGLARAAALAAGSRERSTLERLAAAGESEVVLKRQDTTTLAEIFQFLMRIRLGRQLAAVQAGRPLDHKARPDDLSELERRHLKEAFVTIRQIQDEVRARLHLKSMI